MRMRKWSRGIAAMAAGIIMAGAVPSAAYASGHHAHHVPATPVYADCYQDGVCTGDGCCDEYGVCRNGGSCAWTVNQNSCAEVSCYSGRGHRSGHHH